MCSYDDSGNRQNLKLIEAGWQGFVLQCHRMSICLEDAAEKMMTDIIPRAIATKIKIIHKSCKFKILIFQGIRPCTP